MQQPLSEREVSTYSDVTERAGSVTLERDRNGKIIAHDIITKVKLTCLYKPDGKRDCDACSKVLAATGKLCDAYLVSLELNEAYKMFVGEREP